MDVDVCVLPSCKPLWHCVLLRIVSHVISSPQAIIVTHIANVLSCALNVNIIPYLNWLIFMLTCFNIVALCILLRGGFRLRIQTGKRLN
jgi:hypothetical protein